MKNITTCILVALNFSLAGWSSILTPLEDKMNKHICSNLKLQLTVTGGGGVYGFDDYSDCFCTIRKANKEELRKKILFILDYELREINSYEPIKKHMRNYPFDLTNIYTHITVKPAFSELNYGDLTCVSSTPGELVYSEKFFDSSKKISPAVRAFLEKSDPHKKKHYLWHPEEDGRKEHKESIEDALKICDPKKEHFPTLWKTVEYMKEPSNK